jgi:DNA modification methylase
MRPDLGTKIHIKDIQTNDRIRSDYGDIDSLANSIREFGLIQKIVLTYKNSDSVEEIRLLVGGRRLRALQKLGLSTLIHGDHFFWSGEEDNIRRRGIELEENLRRQNLTWQEQVLAKARLLETMQAQYGPPTGGRPTTNQRIGASPQGFGINKLAAMLGESSAATSKDIELARLIEAVPQLRSSETKEAARRTAQLGTIVALTQLASAKAPAQSGDSKQLWRLVEGDFSVNCVNALAPESVDLVLTDPPYGNDAQGMGPNSKPILAEDYKDDPLMMGDLICNIAKESWRVLRKDTFACFFFDFKHYDTWLVRLMEEGFVVDISPLIWVKSNVINTSPYTRYSRSYEPILLARKGSPKLFRPSQRDSFNFDSVLASGGVKWYQSQKPVELLEKLILDLSAPTGTIADFCAGSGSTGEAAVRLKRNVTLFEINPQACAIIKARLGAL